MTHRSTLFLLPLPITGTRRQHSWLWKRANTCTSKNRVPTISAKLAPSSIPPESMNFAFSTERSHDLYLLCAKQFTFFAKESSGTFSYVEFGTSSIATILAAQSPALLPRVSITTLGSARLQKCRFSRIDSTPFGGGGTTLEPATSGTTEFMILTLPAGVWESIRCLLA